MIFGQIPRWTLENITPYLGANCEDSSRIHFFTTGRHLVDGPGRRRVALAKKGLQKLALVIQVLSSRIRL
ncbi:MAG: hypothetical protein NVS1B11_28590 [Terriglobales bacterium]